MARWFAKTVLTQELHKVTGVWVEDESCTLSGKYRNIPPTLLAFVLIEETPP